MATVVRMPQLAAGGEEATVQEWLVHAGDKISAGQPVVEIETEKATVEHEAETAGVFAGTLVEAGADALVGAPIAVIADEGENLAAALSEGESKAGTSTTGISTGHEELTHPKAQETPEVRTAATPGKGAVASAAVERKAAPGDGESAPSRPDPRERIFASPLVRRQAKEHGVQLVDLEGTGPNGRIVRRDLEDYLAQAPTEPVEPAQPTVSGGDTTGYTDTAHSRMRRAVARRLSESKATVPHYYLRADVHVDELLALRTKVNADALAKISVNDLVLKAVAQALQDVPEANAIWTDDAIRQFDAVDLAMAVSVPDGLLTPVIRGADQLTLTALSEASRDLATRAREGRLKQPELEGGSFTVSNLGMYGTQEFAAIINPPHSGILAVGAASKRPTVTDDGDLSVATVMTVTLSADHRVLDGALGAQWLAAFVARIENPLTILI